MKVEIAMFELGQKVEWTSQANGVAKTKVGEIVQIVPVGKLPDRHRFEYLYRGPGVGAPRRVVSYVVKVGPVFYWPRVSALRVAEGAQKAGPTLG